MELREKIHRERIDSEVGRLLEKDESRMGEKFFECVGIDSSTGRVIHFNSKDLDEGRSRYEDVVAGGAT